MAKFEPKDERALDQLDDEALLAYRAAALEAGDADSAKRALGVLVFRYFDDVHRRCRAKLPPADAEDVAMEAVVSAIRSHIDGTSVGEFRKWLNRIVGRRIADYLRKPGPETTALAEEHSDDEEEIWGVSGFHRPDTGIVELDELVELAMDGLSDAHREVIEVFVFEDKTAADTVADVNERFEDLDPPMSVDNVSQIAKRFRERLTGLLEDAERAGESDEESDNPT